MNERSYVGIDKTDNNEWIAVFLDHGKFIYSRHYRNNPGELEALAHYIIISFTKPKICLNTTDPSAFMLLKYIADIPSVEVMMISNAGLKMHLDWLPKDTATVDLADDHSSRACLLACCAERMI